MWKTLALCILATPAFCAQTPTAKEPTEVMTPPPPSKHVAPMQSYMMIAPAQRALDFQQAFNQLLKEKTAGKVYFQLADGSMISNVIDMTLMANSTLIILRYNSNQGVRMQIVKVEDIVNIQY